MAEVVVLLSTYNGEPYLREQLESLREQSYRDWKCLMRDDGSTDKTREILEAYAAQDARFVFETSDRDHLGPVQSFARLLERAEAYRYYFFCDQDDRWHPDKIEASLEAMRKAESRFAGLPLALHSDLTVTDENLEIVRSSMKSSQARLFDQKDFFAKLVAQNYVTGCTLLINRALRDAAGPIPPAAIMHDWWLALVAAAKGRVLYLDRPTLLYRQHRANASGPAAMNGFWASLRKFFSRFAFMREMTVRRIEQSQALEKKLSREGPSAALFILQDFHRALRGSALALARTLRRHGIGLSSPARSIAYFYLLRDWRLNEDRRKSSR